MSSPMGALKALQQTLAAEMLQFHFIQRLTESTFLYTAQDLANSMQYLRCEEQYTRK